MRRAWTSLPRAVVSPSVRCLTPVTHARACVRTPLACSARVAPSPVTSRSINTQPVDEEDSGDEALPRAERLAHAERAAAARLAAQRPPSAPSSSAARIEDDVDDFDDNAELDDFDDDHVDDFSGVTPAEADAASAAGSVAAARRQQPSSSAKVRSVGNDPALWDDDALRLKGIQVVRRPAHEAKERGVRRPYDPAAVDGNGVTVYTISLRHYHHVLVLQQTERLRMRLLSSLPRIICSEANRTALDTAIVHKGVKLPIRTKRFTVLKSPKGNKTARDQYHFDTHKMLVRIQITGLKGGVFVERFERFLWQCINRESIFTADIQRKQYAHQF